MGYFHQKRAIFRGAIIGSQLQYQLRPISEPTKRTLLGNTVQQPKWRNEVFHYQESVSSERRSFTRSRIKWRFTYWSVQHQDVQISR